MRPQPESGPAPHHDRAPLARGDGPRGLLALHGLTGSPHEVAPIAHAVADAGGVAVRVPLLLMHGRCDHTAPAELSDRVAQRVGSERVRRVILPRSVQIIGRDLDSAQVCDEVTQFVASIPPPSKPKNAGP